MKNGVTLINGMPYGRTEGGAIIVTDQNEIRRHQFERGIQKSINDIYDRIKVIEDEIIEMKKRFVGC